MKRSTVITAVALMVIGLVTFTSVMAVYGFDFRKLSTVEYVTNTYEFSENIDSISVNATTSDVILLPSEDGVCKVVVFEEEKATHSVSVKDNTLSIEAQKQKSWQDFINISFYTPVIKIYLPESNYTDLQIELATGDVEILGDFEFEKILVAGSTGDVRCSASSADEVSVTLSTGDIYLSAVNAGDVTLSLSTGDTKAQNVTCRNLEITGGTGDIELDRVTVSEKMSLQQTTGDIEFESCDAGEIYIETSTGDIEGSLLTEKSFVAESGTGDVEVPRTSSGARCEVQTNTGDIEINIY